MAPRRSALVQRSSPQAIVNELTIRCAAGSFDAEEQAAATADAAATAKGALAVTLARAAEQGIDWALFLETARRNKLLPLAYTRLSSLEPHGDLIPPDVLSHLESATYTSAVRNAQLAEDLDEVVAALHQADVEVIVLKGGALAWTVYADPAQRPMTDLDLLVRPKQMTQAGVVLDAIGFHLSGSPANRMLPFQQQFGGGIDRQRSRYGRIMRLDVQHHLVGVDFVRHAFPVDTDALWAAARPLPLRRSQALQLAPEDMLLHLCLHPALHDGYAGPLLWYVDMDNVIRANTKDNADPFWARFVERATRFRVRTVAAYSLAASRRLVDTPVPDAVFQALAPDRLWLAALRRHGLHALVPLDAETALQDSPKPPGIRQTALYVALMDRPSDVGGMVRAILFPGREWLAVRYGLTTLAQIRRHRFTHPFRVARALLRSLHSPLIQSSLE